MTKDVVFRGKPVRKPRTAPSRNKPPHVRQSTTPRGLPNVSRFSQNTYIAPPSSAKSAPDLDLCSTQSTPYRLPKLRSDGTVSTPDEEASGHRIWGRHGYDVYPSKPIELQVLANQLDASPRVLTQELRRAHLSAAYPKFKEAVISPLHSRGTMYRQLNGDSILYNPSTDARSPSVKEAWAESSVSQSQQRSPSPFGPLQQHLKRNDTMSAKSIHWALTQYRNTSIDTKGKGRSQGPFSREFTVHCAAPNSWKKMKFIRSKTIA